MAFVIAEPCVGTKDTACVEVCPVDCIHEAEDGSSEMLYIDPVECIDCAACVPACPVEAIFAEADLPSKWSKFTQINADFFTGVAAAAAPAAGAAAAAKAAPAKKKAPEPEPLPEPLDLRPEDMYRSLSEMRGDLSENRGVTPAGAAPPRRSPSLTVLVAAVALLLVYVISNNLSKSMNDSIYGRIAASAVGEGKPTLLGAEYTKTLGSGRERRVVQVNDSIFGGRTLTLQAPSAPFLGIYHQDEKFFVSNTNQVSWFFNVFVDENSDGRLDSILRVREFWSKENRLLGRYQNPVPATPELQAAYERAAGAIGKELGLVK